MKAAQGWVVVAMLMGGGWLQGQEAPEAKAPDKYTVKSGTRIPLVLVNSISTKTSREGDRVYLQTAFPIFTDGRIVIPEGSYVTGTITEVKRPGRIKGRGEMYLRFDTLMLRNGVQRDFRGTVSSVDGAGDETLKDDEGQIQGDSTKGKDAGTVAGTAATGASIGAIAGSSVGSAGKGAAIGAGAGSVAGVAAVLLTRGPDVRLLRGSSLEMQLDRDLAFSLEEINFLGSPPPPPIPSPQREPSGSGGGGWGTSPFPRPF